MSHSSNPLKVGIIGAGMVSEHHLNAWQQIEDCRVMAIADPCLESANARAVQFGIDAVYDSAEAMLSAIQLDAVDIVAPVHAHRSLCRLAADHGVAISCQKPLSTSYSDAMAVVTDVDNRVRFMLHENWRFRQPYRMVKAWLDADRIGRPGLVRMRVESSGLVKNAESLRPALVRQPFLAKLPRLLVFEVLIHHLDVLIWLFGELALREAKLQRLCPDVIGEDTAVIILETTDGIPVVLEGCFTVPGAPAGVSDALDIFAERGAIRFADMQLDLLADEKISRGFDFDEVYGQSYVGCITEFVQGLKLNRPFETEAATSLGNLRLVDEIYALAAGSSSAIK